MNQIPNTTDNKPRSITVPGRTHAKLSLLQRTISKTEQSIPQVIDLLIAEHEEREAKQ